MTAYSNSIPQATDRPSDSQALLLSNFQALKVFLDRNHVPIVDPTTNVDEGKHKFLQMPEQGSAPTTATDEGGLYVKEANSRSTLFWRQEGNGTEIQLTRQNPTLSASTGESFLPGGIIIKWGISAGFGSATSKVVSFGGTAFTTVYQFSATLYQTAGASGELKRTFSTSDLGTSSFKAWISSGFSGGINGAVRWIAIGV